MPWRALTFAGMDLYVYTYYILYQVTYSRVYSQHGTDQCPLLPSHLLPLVVPDADRQTDRQTGTLILPPHHLLRTGLDRFQRRIMASNLSFFSVAGDRGVRVLGVPSRLHACTAPAPAPSGLPAHARERREEEATRQRIHCRKTKKEESFPLETLVVSCRSPRQPHRTGSSVDLRLISHACCRHNSPGSISDPVSPLLFLFKSVFFVLRITNALLTHHSINRQYPGPVVIKSEVRSDSDLPPIKT